MLQTYRIKNHLYVLTKICKIAKNELNATKNGKKSKISTQYVPVCIEPNVNQNEPKMGTNAQFSYKCLKFIRFQNKLCHKIEARN